MYFLAFVALTKQSNARASRKDEKRKQQEDPLHGIKHALASKEGERAPAPPAFVPARKQPPVQPERPESAIDRMRRERLAREKQERERVRPRILYMHTHIQLHLMLVHTFFAHSYKYSNAFTRIFHIRFSRARTFVWSEVS